MAAQKTTSRPGYATPREAAEYTGFTVETLRVWRCTGKGPEFCGRGRGVRYRWADIDAFMEARKTRK